MLNCNSDIILQDSYIPMSIHIEDVQMSYLAKEIIWVLNVVVSIALFPLGHCHLVIGSHPLVKTETESPT